MKARPFADITLIAAVLVIAVGCAETPLEFPPPPDAARSEFGTVGVLPAQFGSSRQKPQELGVRIVRGEGEGAIEGLKWAFGPVSDGCGGPVFTQGSAFVCSVTIAYGLAVAPIATLVGAIRSRPASEVEAAERSLIAGFNRMDPRGALRDRIVLAGNSETGFKFLAMDMEGPDAVQSGPAGIDSVMTLSFDPVLRFDDDNIRPTVTLEMQVVASIARPNDATPLHTQIWKYWSEGDDFFDLADDDAKRLEEVAAMAYERLARKIVYDLFVASAPEAHKPEQSGTVWAVDTSSFYDVSTAAPLDGQDAE
ncbi:MAG: hypothetical protein IH926_06230 [Proteobacteria bacterium]|nr:hypothetical protein [Pseudomonadota bacterium]